MDITIISGYSGAGKTTLLRALEDLNFFCVDNLPPGLLPSYAHFMEKQGTAAKKTALCIDARSGNDLQELLHYITTWRLIPHFRVAVIFLMASLPTLIKRFHFTRRKHMFNDRFDLMQALEYEQTLLSPLLDLADFSLATDDLTMHDLRGWAYQLSEAQSRLRVTLLSFGFQYGVPLEATYIYDVRSLPNPYFIPSLTMFTGRENAVQDYLFSQQTVQEYFQHLRDFVNFTLQKAHAEKRLLMTIGIGCTGGKHRSVAMVERLSHIQLAGCSFVVKHRDIEKESLR